MRARRWRAPAAGEHGIHPPRDGPEVESSWFRSHRRSRCRRRAPARPTLFERDGTRNLRSAVQATHAVTATSRWGCVALTRNQPPVAAAGGWRTPGLIVCMPRSARYEPRSPAQGVQVVRDHYETFRAQTDRLCDGAGLPRFVQEAAFAVERRDDAPAVRAARAAGTAGGAHAAAADQPRPVLWRARGAGRMARAARRRCRGGADPPRTCDHTGRRLSETERRSRCPGFVRGAGTAWR
jgi:hypothetical protein